MLTSTEDELESLFEQLYQAALCSPKGTEGTEFRKVIKFAIERSQQEDPVDDGSISKPVSNTTNSLVRFAAYWDERLRYDFDLQDEDAEPIPAKLLGDGFIRIAGEYVDWFPKCKDEEAEILLSINHVRYKSTIRWWPLPALPFVEPSSYLQIYPRLTVSAGSEEEVLAHVLKNAGVEAGDQVTLYVNNVQNKHIRIGRFR